MPLELWLGRGRPLNPYLRGFLIDHLRKAYKPTELKTKPDNLYEDESCHVLS